MSITSEFKVQIVSIDDDGNETLILPALSAAITHFEREANDDEDADADDGFIVSGDDDRDDSDDGDDAADDDEVDPDDEDEKPDAVLYVTTSVSKEVTNDMAVLRDMLSQMLTIRFTFGDDVLVREFEVDSDMWVSMNECAKSTDPLTVLLGFDVYDSRTNF